MSPPLYPADPLSGSAEALAVERARLTRPGYRNVVLLLVIIGFALNFLDRQILSILMQPIKEDLQLSDTALGFLSGLAFAIFYVTMGIPVSRIADRGSRRVVMTVSMAVWSLATCLCGFTRNFGQLFAARVLVGVGEAGFTPSGIALVSDYFPRKHRGKAIGFVNTGPMIGTMLGFLIGGWAATRFGWRGAFVIAGLPGLFFAAVFGLVVREPWRGMADGIVPPPEHQATITTMFKTLWRLPVYRFLIIGAAFSAFGLYGVSLWMPSFLARSHGMALTRIGLTLGPLTGVIGGIGMVIGGTLTDRLTRRDERWIFWMPAIASVLIIPLLATALFAVDIRLAIAAYAGAYFLAVLWVAPTFLVIQHNVPSAMRVSGTACLLLATNLVGLGLGPQMVGIVSDALHASAANESLRYAMLICSTSLILPAIFYAVAARRLTPRSNLEHTPQG